MEWSLPRIQPPRLGPASRQRPAVLLLILLAPTLPHKGTPGGGRRALPFLWACHFGPGAYGTLRFGGGRAGGPASGTAGKPTGGDTTGGLPGAAGCGAAALGGFEWTICGQFLAKFQCT